MPTPITTPPPGRGLVGRLSIGRKLPLLAGGLVLSVAVMVSVAGYLEVRRSTLLTGIDRLRGAAVQFAQSIRTSRTTLVSAVRPIARNAEILAYLAVPNPSSQGAAFDALMVDAPLAQVVALELRDADGKVLLSRRANSGQATSTSGLSFPRPNSPDSGLVGQFVGVQSALVYPTVVRTPGPVTGYLVMWRQLAGNPVGTRLVNQLLGDGATLYIGNADGSLWSDLSGSRSPAVVDGRQVTAPVVLEHAGPQGELLAAAAPAEVLPWLVAVVIPRQVVLAPLGEFVKRMAFGIALCIIAGLVGAVILGRHFTKPLTELTDATIALAQGDYSRRIAFNRADEFGRLAWAFDTMASEVEQSRLRLEDKVVERTRDLNDALNRLGAAQESLVRKERLAVLGQFAGSVGHELRNPLGVMNNAIYYLDSVLESGPEKVKRHIDILRRQIALSAKIVDDLMDFTRIKSPDAQTVSIGSIVDTQLARLGSVDGIRIERKVPPDLPPIYADPVQVGQVVFNLMTNAVQAMSAEGGTLTLRGRSNGASVYLEVSDTGPGIPPEHRDKVFAPLFTTRVNGIGLGLAVSKSFAEANHGSLSVTSDPGRGATFELALPTAPEAIG